MTVPSLIRSVDYPGNGILVAFAYPFRILEQEHMQVTLRSSLGVDAVLALSTHYTLTGVGDQSGGYVTMLTAPATGETLILERVVPYLQLSNLKTQGSFRPEVVEDRLDYLMMAIQQLIEVEAAAASPPVLSYTELTRPVASAIWEGRWIKVRPSTGGPTRSEICLQRSTAGQYDWQPGPSGGFL